MAVGWVAVNHQPAKAAELLDKHMNSSSQLPVRVLILLVAALVVLATRLGLDNLLGAFAAGTLPPQANFRAPAPGLKYADGPFRVLEAVEPWERRGNEPRRAAVSGFGFGGLSLAFTGSCREFLLKFSLTALDCFSLCG